MIKESPTLHKKGTEKNIRLPYVQTDECIDYLTTVGRLHSQSSNSKKPICIDPDALFGPEFDIGQSDQTTRAILHKMVDSGVQQLKLTPNSSIVTLITTDGKIPVTDTITDRDLKDEIKIMKKIQKNYYTPNPSDHPLLDPFQNQALSRIIFTTRHRIGIDNPEIGKQLRTFSYDRGEVERSADGAAFLNAVDMLVLHNQKLLRKICSKYPQSNNDYVFEEYMSVGQKGLIRAAQKYDGTSGNAFSTYATFWIRWAIGKFRADQMSKSEFGTDLSLDAQVFDEGDKTYGDYHLGVEDAGFDAVELSIALDAILDGGVFDKRVSSALTKVLEELRKGHIKNVTRSHLLREMKRSSTGSVQRFQEIAAILDAILYYN